MTNKYQKTLIIFFTLFLTLGAFLMFGENANADENKREIGAVRKVLIVPKGQLAEGIAMSKELGVAEVAEGIPSALRDKVTEGMLPYVYEEIIYKEPNKPDEETKNLIEKLGADVAEYYPVLDENIEAGDLVSVSDKKESILATSTDYLLEKSSRAYDSKLLGVISSKSAMIINSGTADEKPEQILRPVALIGRVPVKISLENGPIEIGDYLTSSNVPGVAMKATGRGKVIGMALESFREVAPPGGGAASTGKIMVFINIGWYDGSSTASTTDVMLSGGFFEKLKSLVDIAIDTVIGIPKMIVGGILEVKNDVVSGGVFKSIVKVAKTVIEGRTMAFDNAASLAEDSQLEVAGEDADSLSFVTYSIISPRKEIMVSGSGKLLTSATSSEQVAAKIVFHPSFSAIISTSTPIRVVVTPTSYINGNLYVAEKSIYGFTVKEINSQDAGGKFDWIITARLTDSESAQGTLENINNLAVQENVGSATSTDSVYQNGANRPCSTEIGACQIGVQIYYDGAWGECMGAVFPTTEICDGVDNDCDGAVDEGGVCAPIVESAPVVTPEPIVTSTEPVVEPIIATSTEPILITTTTPDISTTTATTTP